MGLRDVAKRVGIGVATGGMSEVFGGYGAQPFRQSQYGDMAPSSAYGVPGAADRQMGLDTWQQGQQFGNPATVNAQRSLGNLLMRQAQGQDSLSAEQARQQTSRLQAMQQSQMAGARGGNAAMAARLGMQNMGNIGAQMSGNALMAGIAERTAAAQAAGGVLGQTRGQDIESFMGAQGLGLQQAGMQQQGQISREQIAANRYATDMNTPSRGEAFLGAAQGVGGLMMKSEDKAKRILRALKPSLFEYKPGEGPPGARTGPMASRVQREMPEAVKTIGGDRHLDVGKLVGPALSAASFVNQKVDKLASMLMAPRKAPQGPLVTSLPPDYGQEKGAVAEKPPLELVSYRGSNMSPEAYKRLVEIEKAEKESRAGAARKRGGKPANDPALSPEAYADFDKRTIGVRGRLQNRKK